MSGRSSKLLIFLAVLAAGLSSSLPAAYGQKPKAPPPRGVVDPAALPAASLQGNYFALVIGNNNYQHAPKLQTAVNDATAVAHLLENRYGFKTKLLLDATRDQIMTALVSYRKGLGQNSNLLIYYAGHGFLDREADEAYWLPVDADRDNNMNWVSADDITRGVRAIPSKHVLVISDSCYSGAILGGRNSRDFGAGISPQERLAYLARKDSAKSRNWMASGSVEPVADDGAPGHSIFAGAILQGLGQMNDAQFAASDLFYSYVQRKVGGNSPQLPQYGSIRESGDNLGDFIFSRNGAAPPDARDVPPVIESHEQALPDIVTNHGAFDPGGDQNAITAVLNQYQEGRKRKDAGALWKVWPGASVETKQRIESYFRSASSIRTELSMGSPDIAADHISATVSGQIHEAYVPKNGPSPPARDDEITFALKKNNGVWTIVDVK